MTRNPDPAPPADPAAVRVIHLIRDGRVHLSAECPDTMRALMRLSDELHTLAEYLASRAAAAADDEDEGHGP